MPNLKDQWMLLLFQKFKAKAVGYILTCYFQQSNRKTNKYIIGKYVIHIREIHDKKWEI
jgi:hypothetical protein